MCPACAASAAWVVVGIGSTGGLTALAAKLLHPKKDEEPVRAWDKNNENERSEDYDEGNGDSEQYRQQ